MEASAKHHSDPLPDEVRVNVHEAKTHLSKLLERVENGERIVVCRAGTPVVRLEPWTPIRRRTGFGMYKDVEWAKGLVELAEQPTDPELIDLMENGPLDHDASDYE